MVGTETASAALEEELLLAFERLERERAQHEPAWLGERRRAAIERFRQTGFPTPALEEWRYTNVAPILRTAFADAEATESHGVDQERVERLLGDTGAQARLVFVDGRLRSDLSSGLQGTPARFGPLEELLQQAPEWLADKLAAAESQAPAAFADLNTALFGSGAYLHLPRGCALIEPVEIAHISTRREHPLALHPRLLIYAEEGSAARLVERYHGESGARGWNNSVTELWLDGGARIDREKIEDEATGAYHLSAIRAHLATDAVLVSRLFSLGAGLAREEVRVELAGKGTECTLEGLYAGAGERHADCQTFVDHVAPNGTSSQDFRGILGGQAKGVFSGAVLVRTGAQKTSASQSNANLLLSREATADTKPQLEIFADDVQCQHGATVGQIDPEELFYLRSRGLDEAAARGILTLGFAREITRRAEPGWVREYVERRLLETFDFTGVVPDAPAKLPSGIQSA